MWELVETLNAKYVLMYGHHHRPQDFPKIAMDGLIVELRTPSQSDIPNDHFTRPVQVRDLVAHYARDGAQIWITDARDVTELTEIRAKLGHAIPLVTGAATLSKSLQAKLPRRKFLKKAAGIAAGTSLIGYKPFINSLNLEGEIKNPLIIKMIHLPARIMAGKGIMRAREAVTAYKAEAVVAPQLAKTVGRKPTIGIVWGRGHYDGFKKMLMDQQAREKHLRKNRLERWIKEPDRIIELRIDRNAVITGKKTSPVQFPAKREPTKPKPQSRREFFRRLFHA